MEALSRQDYFTTASTTVAGAVRPSVMSDLLGHIILINDRTQSLFPPSQPQPTHVADLFDPSARRFVERLCELALSDSGSTPVEAVLPSASGGVPLDVVLAPIHVDDNDIVGLNWQIQPVPASDGLQYEQQAWLGFLSSVSLALHASLDLEATLQAVVSACVPFMGDWCLVDLLNSGDSYLHRAAVYHVDPDKTGAVYATRLRYPVSQPEHHPVVGVVSTGVPAIIPHFNDDLLGSMTRDQTHRELIDGLEIRSSMILPLFAPGGIIGAMTFTTAESGRTYSGDDLARAMEYAERAAQAISNARMHQHAVQVSSIRDHYLSVASHELRTPLAVVSGFTTLLIRQVENADPDRETIDMLTGELQRGVARLETLTEDLLVVAALKQTTHLTDVESMDLVELLRSVVERLSVVHPEAAEKITITGDQSVEGRWNPGLLDRAFSNLISNAIKYSPQGVDIRIAVHADGHGFVSVDIQDSGIGISEEEQETLFLPFARGGNARRNSDGTGLGLYITLQIIEQHQGTIDVQSKPNEGSTFSVRIPLRPRTSSGVRT